MHGSILQIFEVHAGKLQLRDSTEFYLQPNSAIPAPGSRLQLAKLPCKAQKQVLYVVQRVCAHADFDPSFYVN